jgi:DNA-binding XRE family transcriptional regulator
MTPAEKLAKRKPRKRPRRNASKLAPVLKCNLREIREALNLSLNVVAAALNLSVSGLFAIEHGRDTQMTTAKKLAKFYGKTLEEIWP